MNLPKRYKWGVIYLNDTLVRWSIEKPKKVRGGYLYSTGQRIVGTNIRLVSRAEYDGEGKLLKGKNWTAFTIALIVAIISALAFKN